MGPMFETLPGNRLHMQHGPIDLIVQAEGDPIAVQAAHEEAQRLFKEVLPTLVTELVLLRQPVDPSRPNPMIGPVAKRMWLACRPFAHRDFITPMAAVAGSVAQHILAPYQRSGIDRAWVNNGGDIALHLTANTRLRLGLFSDLTSVLPVIMQARLPALDAMATIVADTGIGGVATSGWAGRSHSLGIADSVTVFAESSALADAGATMIANAVDVEDELIVRRPANLLSDDTDLGDHLVTVGVPRLAPEKVAVALARGKAVAQNYVDAGILQSVVLVCQSQVVSVSQIVQSMGEEALCQA
ncbi:UPF0280 family protein [Orrella daihaiensis]|uniref:UPF0280 family protein n=1 Tax=Orrella daihaiensis TaxID=2782176 RepID=A0ABY4AIL9_9BURK|nr:UPF0280 family protein [Orrella daihaiensis]UOD50136.1 UPF0280 family protein [Orrella daihaiensis]